MNKDLFSLIGEKLPSFSKGHKLIANYILAHYDKAIPHCRKLCRK